MKSECFAPGGGGTPLYGLYRYVRPTQFFWEYPPPHPGASPLMKPFLTPGGWQLEKCVYWNVSVGLKCVFMSNIDSFANRSPLKTSVSRNVDKLDSRTAICLFDELRDFVFVYRLRFR